MNYRLIGIDLDGTLLNDRGRVSEANRRAILAAREAGAMVVPCTGRGWIESRHALADVEGLDLGVFVTGAAVVEMASGRSADLAVIEPHLAHDLVEFLKDEPEAVLAYREANLAGHDYLVTGHGQLTGNTEWWFQFTGATVHFQRDVGPEDLHHVLRVGMVTNGPRVAEICRRVAEAFGDRVLLHHFASLIAPDEAQSVHVLEIFGQGVDKWRGLSWIAQRHDIPPEQVATIGDEINDLSMLGAAGCGIAMGNACDQAKRHARHVTRANHEDGVAHAIEQMLAGAW